MDKNLVVVGRIAGLYGVKGWFKVISYTEPRRNILDYQPWHLEQAGVIEPAGSLTGQIQGKSLVAHLAGIEDRDAAAGLVGANIFVNRDLFAQTERDEYYWRDLAGLQVMNVEELAGLSEGAANRSRLEWKCSIVFMFLAADYLPRLRRVLESSDPIPLGGALEISNSTSS